MIQSKSSYTNGMPEKRRKKYENLKIYKSCIIVIIVLMATSMSLTNVWAKDNLNIRIPVLLYHHILPDCDNTNQKENSAVVSLEDFEAQMKYLYDNEYYTATSEEIYNFLYNDKPLPPKTVVIHFDDGYYSNIVHAYPVLKQYGFKATIFPITSLVSEKQEDFVSYRLIFISQESIATTRDVFEYASHTHDMHALAGDTEQTKLVAGTKEEIVADLKTSFQIVDYTRSFAYPRGQYNNDTIEILKTVGIDTAYTVNPKYITKKSVPHELGRFIIYQNIPLETFQDVVSGNFWQ